MGVREVFLFLFFICFVEIRVFFKMGNTSLYTDESDQIEKNCQYKIKRDT